MKKDVIKKEELLEIWKKCPNKHYCIAQIGFDDALTFISVMSLFLEFKAKNPSNALQRLQFIIFTASPLSLDELSDVTVNNNIHETVRTSLIEQYPLRLKGCHRVNIENHIQLDFWFGNIKDNLTNIRTPKIEYLDACYLDLLGPHNQARTPDKALLTMLYQSITPASTLVCRDTSQEIIKSLDEVGFTVAETNDGKDNPNYLRCITGKTTKDSTEDIPPESDHNKQQNIAIIGGGIASLCTAISLSKRGNNVTIYCADSTLGAGASGNLQGALYPLLNRQHDALSQLFSNAFIYARNFYQNLHKTHPFSHQFNGLLQLAYDHSSLQKLTKIREANFPYSLVKWVEPNETDQLAGVDIDQSALYYSTSGWLSPKEAVLSMKNLLEKFDNVKIHCDYKIENITHQDNFWVLEPANNKNLQTKHEKVIIAAGFDTIKFQQCRAIPLSAARGQVSHVATNAAISPLKRTLCHEGYITPVLNSNHCMGATFKRHDEDIRFRPAEQIDNYNKLMKCIPSKAWVSKIKLPTEGHAAIRCTTRDHFPYLGEMTNYDKIKEAYLPNRKNNDDALAWPNAYVITGLGSRGLCTAPLLAEILASEINNEVPPLDGRIIAKMKIPRQWISYMNKNKPLKF